MRAFILVLALSITTSLSANEKQCDSFADVMYTIAEQRDIGVSRREMRARIIRETDASMHETFLAIADIAYQRPFYSPEEEANAFYTECIKALGATRTEFTF
jgi:hypothetical protein